MADPVGAPGGPAASGRGLRFVLIAVLAVAALTSAGTVGWLVGHRDGAVSVSNASVDAGFARDMATHHQQAVTMAGFERDHTENRDLGLLAYNIEDTQSFEIGEMQGWLDSWGLERSTNRAQMTWMGGHVLGSDNLMPGMATGAQLTHLQALQGKALDIAFLQLMIRHHQGGIPMERYAAQHAKQPYVRNLARSMMLAQSSEIVSMEQTLRQLGGAPLPPPTS
ncbi:MAG: DUF305 domain-containing protein [Actinomycetota bacterium]|nr:DUF305 domain-containing protein [Actinomycetota bacterium]